MLIDLEFNVTFSSTGKSISAKHSFTEGITSISGKNESGKSLRLEIIRFCLFGTRALRDGNHGYEKLKALLNFKINDQVYKVERTLNNAFLNHDGIVIAKGAKPVNNRIKKLFGYGLDVFDTSHCILQGEIEALSNMLPTDRKKMVDQTIGLDVFDGMIQRSVDEAASLSKEAEFLKSNLYEPKTPVKPEVLMSVDVCEQILKDQRETDKERQRLETRLNMLSSIPDPVPPVKPCDETSEELDNYQRIRITAVKAKIEIEAKIASRRPVTLSQEQIEQGYKEHQAYNSYMQYERELMKNPPPKHTKNELTSMEKDLELLNKYEELLRIDLLIASLEKKGEHTCPACSHKWAVEQAKIDELKASRPSNLPPNPEKPTLSLGQISREKSLIDSYVVIKPVPNPGTPRYSIKELQNAERGLEDAEIILPDIPLIPVDKQNLLILRAKYESELFRYQSEISEFYKRISEIKEIEKNLSGLPKTDVPKWENLLLENKLYKSQMDAFFELKSLYESGIKTIEDKQQKIEECSKIKDALKNVKIKVKQHLIPSLNAVASELLSQMTAGQRTKVEVSEEFEITVDGQPLHTLSGSGKAVSNLAIRIGLGQVLTSKVFPVLMGDELDSSMDETRTNATTDALWGLKSYLKQIILVSHKSIEADQKIEV